MDNGFKVYKSSAGSGKTFTLIKEFLKICLQTNDPFRFSSILAITFTNKATLEMKERLINNLKEITDQDPDAHELSNILKKELAIDDSILISRSKVLLNHILHNYTELSISTIDKFTYKLLKTFAKDLRIPMNFQVEIDEMELLLSVLHQLEDKIGVEREVTQLLLEFVSHKMEEEKSWKLKDELLNFSSNLLKEQSVTFLKELRNCKTRQFNETKNAYLELNRLFLSKVVERASEGLKLINNASIEDKSFAGNAKISTYFRKLVSGTQIEPSKQLIDNVAKDNWHSSKCSPEQKKTIDSVSAYLKKIFDEINEIIQSNIKDYYARQAIIDNLHNLSLINEIEKNLSNLKEKEQILSISDFNKVIAKIVLTESIPFIYERMGERFKHIMIDEFQDTSILQFANLLPLIEESLSNGNESLIVGDGKQAIYRFRGGDVDQFVDIPDYVNEQDELSKNRMYNLKNHYSNVVLNANYRSSPALVDFNNRFFDFIKTTLPNAKLEKIYENHQQEIKKTLPEGYVELSFYSDTGDDLANRYATECYEKVLSIKQDGYYLKDIAILCRKKGQATFIASYLSEQGLSVISSEALLLNNHRPVEFIIDLIKWIFQPNDDNTVKRILQFLYDRNWTSYDSINELLSTVFLKNEPFIQLLKEMGFNLPIEKLKKKTLIELIEYLIRAFQLNEEYDTYLQFLQEFALEHSRSKGEDIPSFLVWWDNAKGNLSIDLPENQDAITIMTIHKSKGLEFPVIIYPFAEEKIEHSTPFKRSYLWAKPPPNPKVSIPFVLVEFNKILEQSSLSNYYDDELEKKIIDMINLTYVAFTRAAERLYIMTKTSSSNRSINLPYLLKQFCNFSNAAENQEETYHFGEKTPRKLEVKRSVAHQFPMVYSSNSWHDKLLISPAEDVEENESIAYGNIIHQLFSKMSSIEDLENIIESFVLKGLLDSDEKNELHSKLKSLLSSAHINRFFQKENTSKRESILVDQAGNILKPDRVVYFKDEVAVLEFKTGAENEEHIDQVGKYKKALENTTTLPVRSYLLYTESEKLISVKI